MYPPHLKKGDKVCIISPSGIVDEAYIEGAKHRLESWGLKVSEGFNARNKYGRYAGTIVERCHDLQFALDDTEIKAVFCSRGGYGLSQIIDKIDFSTFVKSPKWIIGFSDVTVLHNAISNLGIASLHAIMAKNMTEAGSSDRALNLTKDLLFGKIPEYHFEHALYNKNGSAEARIIGGNFTVFMSLRNTEFDLDFRNALLFIEDIGEEAYRIDRLMQNLRLAGVLEQISGLIVGQFTDYDKENENIEQIISETMMPYHIPVCFNFPSGHIDENYPLILGERAEFRVDESGVSLRYLK